MRGSYTKFGNFIVDMCPDHKAWSQSRFGLEKIACFDQFGAIHFGMGSKSEIQVSTHTLLHVKDENGNTNGNFKGMCSNNMRACQPVWPGKPREWPNEKVINEEHTELQYFAVPHFASLVYLSICCVAL